MAAVVFAASASVLALEPHVGVMYARLIPAFVVLAIVFASWLSNRPAATAAPQMPLQAQAQTAQRTAQFAMIVEAVLLGYSMARRR